MPTCLPEYANNGLLARDRLRDILCWTKQRVKVQGQLTDLVDIDADRRCETSLVRLHPLTEFKTATELTLAESVFLVRFISELVLFRGPFL